MEREEKAALAIRHCIRILNNLKLDLEARKQELSISKDKKNLIFITAEKPDEQDTATGSHM